MKIRKTAGLQGPDLPLVLSLLIAFVSVPGSACAVQVGCFFTAIFIGTMFMIGLGLTVLVKHLMAKYLWKMQQTPWKRMFALTVLELFLIIAVFASIRTNIVATLLIYLPFGILLNVALLKKFSAPGAATAPAAAKKRYACCCVLPLALPASIQAALMLATAITNLITFTDLRI